MFALALPPSLLQVPPPGSLLQVTPGGSLLQVPPPGLPPPGTLRPAASSLRRFPLFCRCWSSSSCVHPLDWYSGATFCSRLSNSLLPRCTFQTHDGWIVCRSLHTNTGEVTASSFGIGNTKHRGVQSKTKGKHMVARLGSHCTCVNWCMCQCVHVSQAGKACSSWQERRGPGQGEGAAEGYEKGEGWEGCSASGWRSRWRAPSGSASRGTGQKQSPMRRLSWELPGSWRARFRSTSPAPRPFLAPPRFVFSACTAVLRLSPFAIRMGQEVGPPPTLHTHTHTLCHACGHISIPTPRSHAGLSQTKCVRGLANTRLGARRTYRSTAVCIFLETSEGLVPTPSGGRGWGERQPLPHHSR